MQFDYFIYVFILIAFIYGMYRGIKRELSFLIAFSIAVFVPLYLYDVIKGLIESFIPISSIYEKISIVTNIFNMSEGGFEFFIVYWIPFILINFILNGLLYVIIFKNIKVKRKEISKLQRLLGGLVGIVVGIELSLVMMISLNSIMALDMSGFVSNLLQSIPKIKDFISLTAQLGEVV